MRTLMLTLAILAGAMTLSSQPTLSSSPSPISAIGVATLNAYPAIQDVKPPQINVEVKRDGGGGRWYMSPVWVAIGAIAAVLVILLVVLAARGGGGTTVVRG